MDNTQFKGRGTQLQSHNPYLSSVYVTEHKEGLDEALLTAPQTKVFYETPRKIVNKVDSPDLKAMYSLNPYQGCEHGCTYCYARTTHEYWGYSAGLDFESKIIVKKNAPALLEQQLLLKRWRPSPIMLSGNTDCYQPLERKLGITRKLLEVFLKYRHPVGIITKNSLVIRDIDLLEELAEHQLVHVYFSINSLNEDLRKVLEPRTASALKKMKTMEKLASRGIPVGIMAAPLIPGLNHHEIPSLLKMAAEHGASEAGYTVVRLNRTIAQLFEDWLERHFPDRKEKVWNQVCSLHGGKVNDSVFGRRQQGEGPIAMAIKNLFHTSKKKYFGERSLPAFDVSKFRKGGNYTLFEG